MCSQWCDACHWISEVTNSDWLATIRSWEPESLRLLNSALFVILFDDTRPRLTILEPWTAKFSFKALQKGLSRPMLHASNYSGQNCSNNSDPGQMLATASLDKILGWYIS